MTVPDDCQGPLNGRRSHGKKYFASLSVLGQLSKLSLTLSPFFQASKDKFVNLTVPKLEDFQRRLQKVGGVWFVGPKLTFIDFLVYESFDQARLLFPGILVSLLSYVCSIG